MAEKLDILSGESFRRLESVLPLLQGCLVIPAGDDAPGFYINDALTQMVLKIKTTTDDKTGTVSIDALNGLFEVRGKLIGPSSGGGGGGGLPAGYTFEEFTICDSGSPATRYWPTWTSDPS